MFPEGCLTWPLPGTVRGEVWMTYKQWAALAVVTVALMTGCTATADQTMDPAEYQQQPYLNRMPRTGEEVSYALLTHCGIEFAQIGGRTWQAQRMPFEVAARQAPAGWDNPFQQGRLVIDASGRATFTARNTDLVYTLADEGFRPPGCK